MIARCREAKCILPALNIASRLEKAGDALASVPAPSGPGDVCRFPVAEFIAFPLLSSAVHSAMARPRNRPAPLGVTIQSKPDFCPHCDSRRINKRGLRKNTFRHLQIYWCRDCGRYFSSLAGLKGVKYPPRVIVRALCLYNLGHSQEEAARPRTSLLRAASKSCLRPFAVRPSGLRCSRHASCAPRHQPQSLPLGALTTASPVH
jgi:transposase-like protein